MKTRTAALIIMFLVFLPRTLLGQLYEGVKGDVNNDGSINVLDIVITVNHIIGADTLNENEILRADCNSFRGNCGGDGTVDILDAVKIANILVDVDKCLEPLIDIDGNVYKIVMIGDQVWMAENLKVTHYSNGDPIQHVTSNSEWASLTTGATCGYDNNVDNIPAYGWLYNWYAVNDSRGIAPAGWHVPTDEEWKQLEMYLGMSQQEADATQWRGTDEGGKMKESGSSRWDCPNTGATNESGFSALPGGFRAGSNGYFSGGSFRFFGGFALFWSSTEGNSFGVWGRWLGCDSGVNRSCSEGKDSGLSVRCIRNN